MISGLVRAMPTCSNLALMASNLFSISPIFRAQRYDFVGTCAVESGRKINENIVQQGKGKSLLINRKANDRFNNLIQFNRIFLISHDKTSLSGIIGFLR